MPVRRVTDFTKQTFKGECVVCGVRFYSEKPALYHNNACKQKAYRQRKQDEELQLAIQQVQAEKKAREAVIKWIPSEAQIQGCKVAPSFDTGQLQYLYPHLREDGKQFNGMNGEPLYRNVEGKILGIEWIDGKAKLLKKYT